MNHGPPSRRIFLKRLGVSGLAASLPLRAEAQADDSRKPNIIVILADDLGFGDLECYRGTLVKTPRLNELARQGMRFANFHASSPVDRPTRAALLTGRYPHRYRIESDTQPKKRAKFPGLPLGQVTFAKLLKDNGYKTALFGKWDLGTTPAAHPARHGFDEFRGYVGESVDYHSHIDAEGARDWWINTKREEEKGYVTDLITQHGIRFMEEHRDEPFCLYLSHAAPHWPLQGRKDPPVWQKGNPGPVEELRRDPQVVYREMIEVLDEGIGRILETVKRLDLESDTFLFFSSDNGAREPGSNGSLIGRKGTLFEGGIRVPAIAWWPGKIKANLVSMDPAMTMDLFPTLAQISGATIPEGVKMDGISLCPALLHGKALPQRTLFWRYGTPYREKAVIQGSWKLYITKQKSYLFNLDYDISEQLNFFASRSDIVALFQKALGAWEKDVDRGVTR